MFDVGIWAAFTAGLLSFVSPCVLPVVPLYLAYLAGMNAGELSAAETDRTMARRIVVATLLFVAGFSTVFVAMGATASLLGKALAGYFNILSVAAGVIIIVMGLHFLGVFRIALLYREARFQLAVKPTNPVIAYVLGLAFAFGWTPCVGPILAGILFLAGAEQTLARGALLLAAYSLGIGLPFVLAALFSASFIGWTQRFRRHMRKVEIAVGALMLVMGVLFISGQVPTISYWLLETFPSLSKIG
jgi:cytochrome c-type biogenesis protein